MITRILGGALAALLILSDRIAFVALAIAAIALARLAAAKAPRLRAKP